MTAAPFVSEMRVRFQHCDPAGIVFYPRYFEMINDFIDTWFEQALGHSFHVLHEDMGLGTPTANIQIDFTSPSRWDERLRQVLAVRRVGGASFTVDVRFEGADGGQKLAATVTIVTVSLATMRPTPLPEAVRARMAAYLVQSPAPPARDRPNHNSTPTG
jgi:4-hydroxybenzoyl-CoA thioesterase